MSHLDRLAAAAARAVLAWSTAHAHPARRQWVRGLAAELDEMSSGTEQLAWALGTPGLLWYEPGGIIMRSRLALSNPRGLGVLVGVLLVGLTAALLVVGVPVMMDAAVPVDTQCTASHTPSAPAPAQPITAADYVVLGDYDEERGACAEAVAAYTRAIALEPDLAAAYNNRAITRMHQQRYADALADLDQAISLRPTYANALMNRGDIYNYYGPINYGRAVADYDRVIALGATQGTSVCGHRLLAINHGWGVGVLANIVLHGADGGCAVPSPRS